MYTIKEAVVKGLRYAPVPVTIDEATVSMLVARVTAANPAKPASYAHFVARNYAITQARQERARTAREARAMMDAMREREAAEKKQRAQVEFVEIVERILKGLLPSRRHGMAILWFQTFDGEDDAACARLLGFPTTRTQRWQWKHRALKVLKPLVSPALWSLIASRPRISRG